MPEKRTLERARKAKRAGKAPTTQAGEFVREEIEHVREGQHGVRNTKQAIAIGLSKARRAGVRLPPPAKGRAKESTRRKSARDYRKGGARRGRLAAPGRGSAKRARATMKALKREGKRPVSRRALSRQAQTAARRRRQSSRR